MDKVICKGFLAPLSRSSLFLLPKRKNIQKDIWMSDHKSKKERKWDIFKRKKQESKILQVYYLYA